MISSQGGGYKPSVKCRKKKKKSELWRLVVVMVLDETFHKTKRVSWTLSHRKIKKNKKLRISHSRMGT